MKCREFDLNKPFLKYGNWASKILHFKQIDPVSGILFKLLSNILLLNPVLRCAGELQAEVFIKIRIVVGTLKLESQK